MRELEVPRVNMITTCIVRSNDLQGFICVPYNSIMRPPVVTMATQPMFELREGFLS